MLLAYRFDSSCITINYKADSYRSFFKFHQDNLRKIFTTGSAVITLTMSVKTKFILDIYRKIVIRDRFVNSEA